MVAGFFLAVGLGGAPMLVSPASAQSPLQPSPDAKMEIGSSHWSTHFDRQIAHALKQEPSMRASHIQVVIEAAVETEHLNLSRTVGALLDVIERDSNLDHRLMAVQALHRIGPEHVGEKQYRRAMSRLYTLTQSNMPEQVRVAAEGTLAQYTTAG